MKSRLLTRRELEALSEARGLPGLITVLAATAYSKPIEAALARTSGMEGFSEALRADMIATLEKIQHFYTETAGEMVKVILSGFDVHNVKALLRGLSKHASPSEIRDAMLPVGELDHRLLAELASTPGGRAAIDRLASMNLAIAQPLIHLRGEHPGADTPEMELALDRWYYQRALKFLKDEDLTDSYLGSAIKLDADIANLLTILRFAHAPMERKLVRQQYGVDDIRALLLGPGFLPFDLLLRASEQDTVESAVNVLAGTRYADHLTAGLQAFRQSGRLSSFERQLKHYRLNWMAGLIARDPLGIGVVIGYLALKINEINNLRWIAQGVRHGLPTGTIRAEMEYAG